MFTRVTLPAFSTAKQFRRAFSSGHSLVSHLRRLEKSSFGELPQKPTECPVHTGPVTGSCKALETCCHDSTCAPFECSVCCGTHCCPYPMTCCGGNCCNPGTECDATTRQCTEWPTKPDTYSIKDTLNVTLHAYNKPYVGQACSSANYQYMLHYGKKTSVSLGGGGYRACWTGYVKVSATDAERPEDILITFDFGDGMVCLHITTQSISIDIGVLAYHKSIN